MYVPFGVSVFDSDRGPRYTMELSFNNMNEGSKMEQFFKRLGSPKKLLIFAPA